jgi:hypothetical protein
LLIDFVPHRCPPQVTSEGVINAKNLCFRKPHAVKTTQQPEMRRTRKRRGDKLQSVNINHTSLTLSNIFVAAHLDQLQKQIAYAKVIGIYAIISRSRRRYLLFIHINLITPNFIVANPAFFSDTRGLFAFSHDCQGYYLV